MKTVTPSHFWKYFVHQKTLSVTTFYENKLWAIFLILPTRDLVSWEWYFLHESRFLKIIRAIFQSRQDRPLFQKEKSVCMNELTGPCNWVYPTWQVLLTVFDKPLVPFSFFELRPPFYNGQVTCDPHIIYIKRYFNGVKSSLLRK